MKNRTVGFCRFFFYVLRDNLLLLLYKKRPNLQINKLWTLRKANSSNNWICGGICPFLNKFIHPNQRLQSGFHLIKNICSICMKLCKSQICKGQKQVSLRRLVKSKKKIYKSPEKPLFLRESECSQEFYYLYLLAIFFFVFTSPGAT